MKCLALLLLIGLPCLSDISTTPSEKPLSKSKVECLKTIFGSTNLRTPGHLDVSFRRSKFHLKREGMNLTFSSISSNLKNPRSYLRLHDLKSPDFKTYILQQAGDDDETNYDIIFTIDNTGKLIDSMIAGEVNENYTREFAFEEEDIVTIKENGVPDYPENSGYSGRFHIKADGFFELAARR